MGLVGWALELFKLLVGGLLVTYILFALLEDENRPRPAKHEPQRALTSQRYLNGQRVEHTFRSPSIGKFVVVDSHVHTFHSKFFGVRGACYGNMRGVACI